MKESEIMRMKQWNNDSGSMGKIVVKLNKKIVRKQRRKKVSDIHLWEKDEINDSSNIA